MARPRIGDHAMTPAERQRRRRAKLREKVKPDDVVAYVMAQIARGGVNAGKDIVRRLTKELARWRRERENADCEKLLRKRR